MSVIKWHNFFLNAKEIYPEIFKISFVPQSSLCRETIKKTKAPNYSLHKSSKKKKKKKKYLQQNPAQIVPAVKQMNNEDSRAIKIISPVPNSKIKKIRKWIVRW